MFVFVCMCVFACVCVWACSPNAVELFWRLSHICGTLGTVHLITVIVIRCLLLLLLNWHLIECFLERLFADYKEKMKQFLKKVWEWLPGHHLWSEFLLLGWLLAEIAEGTMEKQMVLWTWIWPQTIGNIDRTDRTWGKSFQNCKQLFSFATSWDLNTVLMQNISLFWGKSSHGPFSYANLNHRS